MELESKCLQALPSASRSPENPAALWSADTVPAWADLLGRGREEECYSQALICTFLPSL